MSNKEMFMTFANHDFLKVQEALQNGLTETSDFKERLEALYSSLDALLMDMDIKGQEYA